MPLACRTRPRGLCCATGFLPSATKGSGMRWHIEQLSGFYSLLGTLTVASGLLFLLLSLLSARTIGAAAEGIVGAMCFLPMGILQILTGRYLSGYRHPRFCLVMACVTCVWFPFGTLMGIFTILDLSRPAIRARFNLREA